MANAPGDDLFVGRLLHHQHASDFGVIRNFESAKHFKMTHTKTLMRIDDVEGVQRLNCHSMHLPLDA